MIDIGCDYHPGFRQIALVDTETGDFGSPTRGFSLLADFHLSMGTEVHKFGTARKAVAGGLAVSPM